MRKLCLIFILSNIIKANAQVSLEVGIGSFNWMAAVMNNGSGCWIWSNTFLESYDSVHFQGWVSYQYNRDRDLATGAPEDWDATALSTHFGMKIADYSGESGGIFSLNSTQGVAEPTFEYMNYYQCIFPAGSYYVQYNRLTKEFSVSDQPPISINIPLQYQLTQQKLGNCPTSPVKLSVKTSVKVKTDSAGSIGGNTATAYGNILNDGGKNITRRGFCWSTSANPTLSNSFIQTGSGNFSGSLSGLSPSTTYYLRAYAGTATEVWYGNDITFSTAGGSSSSATCGTLNIHNPNLTYGTMTDQDGNSYKTIVIGTQEWMAENLKTGHYRNGEVIPTVLDDVSWQGLTSGAVSWYNDDSSAFDCPFGKLYNWYAVVDPRGLCPAGWHVPSDAEWTVLDNSLGGIAVAGGKLKSVSNLWASPNIDATNESGFSALPGGYRYAGFDLGQNGNWWTSTKEESEFPWSRNLWFQSGGIGRYNDDNPSFGFSVRCLKDAPETGSINSLNCGAAVNKGTLYAGQAASGITVTLPYTGGNGGNHSNRVIASSGITGLTATLAAGNFASGDSSLFLTINGTPAASGNAVFALNIGGQSCSFTCLVVSIGGGVTDIDGNSYGSVLIGTQEWMQQNLKVSKYRNGDNIPFVNQLNIEEWVNTTNGAYGIYNDDAVNDSIFGKLYNWYAVADPRGLCPAGWHIPSDEEWTFLENYLGGSSVAGGKMKSVETFSPDTDSWGTGLWVSPNTGATNSSGFTALPASLYGGCAICPNGTTLWWSSTEKSTTDAWFRNLNFYVADSYRDSGGKNAGFSVRCLKD